MAEKLTDKLKDISNLDRKTLELYHRNLLVENQMLRNEIERLNKYINMLEGKFIDENKSEV